MTSPHSGPAPIPAPDPTVLAGLHGRSLLRELDFTPEEWLALIHLAARLKADKKAGREVQHLVGRNEASAIDRFTRDLAGFHKADVVHYDALLRGCVENEAALDALITPKLDRGLTEISPIEHACMWIGVYEFQNCPDVPWRVVLNECIELAKEFGGTDGHKYVNAVLNGLAPELRSAEVAHDRANKSAS